MPRYDYYCESNGMTVEVVHSMSAKFQTWGEVCERSGLCPGDTSFDAPVVRLIASGITMGLSNDQAGIDRNAFSSKPASSCNLGGCACC